MCLVHANSIYMEMSFSVAQVKTHDVPSPRDLAGHVDHTGILVAKLSQWLNQEQNSAPESITTEADAILVNFKRRYVDIIIPFQSAESKSD